METKIEAGDTVRIRGTGMEGTVTQICGRGICEVTAKRKHKRTGGALPDKVCRPYLTRLDLVRKAKK